MKLLVEKPLPSENNNISVLFPVFNAFIELFINAGTCVSEGEYIQTLASVMYELVT